MSSDTRADLLIGRLKNNRFISVLIVVGIVLSSLLAFAKGLEEAGKLFGKAFGHGSEVAQYDAQTKEALLASAREVDLFFLTIESKNEPPSFSEVAPEFIKIKADLRSLLMRNQVRPLNSISTQQTKLLIEQWSNVEKLLKLPERSSPAATSVVREIMFQAFDATITLEVAKEGQGDAQQ
ncbi:hypothetical protein C4K68_12690 [Pokkaliibacter plantistimulans]|uniref:Chemotaxis methyl-accepting receptor HlyB-like 4HB MCP domain-containing protein n=1 Tax=Proteobacteria bacterium 228 TaxID=2083153 RepID=A0A2S5KRT4_9PROT|nr:hypothetical protein [Pokkaliibacter plantistimulans]PPC76966.1 hypothetical protein C4K68_12690 [Pokkaliibacter plantistimulans]